MHEYAITCSIIDIIRDNIKDKDFKKVTKVDFEIKRLSHIEPGSIKFYYGFLTEKDDALKDAELVFAQKDPKVICSSCGRESELKSLDIRCSHCQSTEVKLLKEDELRIVSIDID